MSSSRPGHSTAGHCPRKMTVATYQEMILSVYRIFLNLQSQVKQNYNKNYKTRKWKTFKQ